VNAASHPRNLRVNIFLLAIWFGVVYGLVSRTALLVLAYREPPLTFVALASVDAQIFVAAPLFTVLMFLLAGLGMMVAGGLIPKLPAERLAWLAYFFLSFVGLLLLPARLHRVAVISLALGLAAAAYRWVVAPRLESATRFARRSLPAVIVLWGVIAGGVVLAERWQEARQVA
jgi:hypothetical protein